MEEEPKNQIQSQKDKSITSKIKTKQLKLFKELAFQSSLPQTVDTYNNTTPSQK